MKIQREVVQKIELDEEETKLIIELLNYCYHRAFKHKSPVTIFAERIQKLRRGLGII